MKKNITINLCGMLYNIDEDAYELLNKYTNSLRDYFSRKEGGDEIVNDIEERIAELLNEIKAGGVEAITIEHVNNIIQRVGNLHDITQETESDRTETSSETNGAENNGYTNKSAFSQWYDGLKKKRLYRDTQNKILGGVLSGCSKYFGGDVLLWRIVFVILSLGTIKALFVLPTLFGMMLNSNIGLFGPFVFFGVIINMLVYSGPVVVYAIVYFLLPEASSPEDMLRMKGKDVNAHNLGNEVAESARGYDKGESQQQSSARGCLNGFFSAIALIVKIILWIIGIMLFVPCCVFICLLIAGFLETTTVLQFILGCNKDMATLIYEKLNAELWTSGVCIVLISFIPAYCVVHCVLTLFREAKSMSLYQRLAWLFLWLIAIGGFFDSWIKIQNYKSELRQKERSVMYERHTHDGIDFLDIDWEYFSRDGWKLLKHTNCVDNRYTYSGQHYTGDESVRYLDAFSPNCDIIYHAEKTDSVTPGRYVLNAMGRCAEGGKGVCIYVRYVDENDNDVVEKVFVPAYGSSKPEGGNHYNVFN